MDSAYFAFTWFPWGLFGYMVLVGMSAVACVSRCEQLVVNKHENHT
jgi:hypothetical protein